MEAHRCTSQPRWQGFTLLTEPISVSLSQSKACPPCLSLPALPAPPLGTGPLIARGLPEVLLSLPRRRRRQRCQHYSSEHEEMVEAQFGEGERGSK